MDKVNENVTQNSLHLWSIIFHIVALYLLYNISISLFSQKHNLVSKSTFLICKQKNHTLFLKKSFIQIQEHNLFLTKMLNIHIVE